MASYNKIILVGNLTRDPQLRYLPSQMAVVDFGLAVNHKFKTKDGESREEVCFIDCSAFGRSAEVINQYCHKGKPLLVEGRLKLDNWDDKQTGAKRSKHTVVIENFQLLGGAPGQGGQAGGGQQQYDESQGSDEGAPPPQRRTAPPRPQARGAQQPAAPARAQPEQPFSEEQQFKDDDIPF